VQGKFRGQLYELNCILDESYDEQGNCLVNIKLPLREWNRLLKQDEVEIEHFIQT